MVTVMVFHLGTLALGSLVLAVVRSKKCGVRVVFSFDQSEASLNPAGSMR